MSKGADSKSPVGIRVPARRLSRSLLVGCLLLSALTLLMVPLLINELDRHYSYFIVNASRLDEEPQAYFSVTAPDAVAERAFEKPGTSVWLNSSNETQLDEMVFTYNTSNAEFNGNYFKINFGMVFIDYGPPYAIWLFPFLLMGWFLWVVGFVRYRGKSSNSLEILP